MFSATLALVGVASVAAAFAIGLAGWPPSRAHAESAPNALGVTEATAVRLTGQTRASEKFAVAAGRSGARNARGELSKTKKKSLSKPRFATKVGVVSKGRPTGKGWRACRVSWYGPGFYGHTMAGGGRLRRGSMVVAHRSMPFGTKVQISYRGRTVTAVVRDRGPFIAGRTFDLGPGTAKALRFSGVGSVKYRIVRK